MNECPYVQASPVTTKELSWSSETKATPSTLDSR